MAADDDGDGLFLLMDPGNTMSVEYTASIVQDGAGKKTNVSEIERKSQRIFVQNWSIINILSPAKLTKLMKLLNLLNKFAIFLVIFVQKFHFFGRLNDHANHLCNDDVPYAICHVTTMLSLHEKKKLNKTSQPLIEHDA